MPKMSGLEASPLIAKLPGNTRVQIFTMHESERITNDVKMAGAHGYVQKSQAGRDLVVAKLFQERQHSKFRPQFLLGALLQLDEPENRRLIFCLSQQSRANEVFIINPRS